MPCTACWDITDGTVHCTRAPLCSKVLYSLQMYKIGKIFWNYICYNNHYYITLCNTCKASLIQSWQGYKTIHINKSCRVVRSWILMFLQSYCLFFLLCFQTTEYPNPNHSCAQQQICSQKSVTANKQLGENLKSRFKFKALVVKEHREFCSFFKKCPRVLSS